MKFFRDLYSRVFMLLWIPIGLLMAIAAAGFQMLIAIYQKLTVDPKQQQHELFEEVFHRAVSLIEMHKIRFGDYPSNLFGSQVIPYLVSDDLKVIQSVGYRKVELGYELNVGDEELVRIHLPKGFWQGLGIVKTNVEGYPGSEGNLDSVDCEMN